MVKLLDITGKAISGEWGTDCDHQDGIPVLRTTNFRNNGTINYDNVVIRNIIKDVKNKFLCYGDIIIEKSGGSDKQPVGRVVYFDGKGNRYLFNNFTGVLRVKNTDRWNPKYIFYALFAAYKRGETRRFENRTTGLHNLQLDSYVKNFNIQEISITYQNKICDILDNIHHQIILREKELTHLDDLVKARFVEMFGHMSVDTTVSDVCSIITDGTHQPPKFKNEGIPFLFVSNIADNKLTYDTEKFIDEATYNELIKRTPIEVGDVLLSTVGSYGHPAVVENKKRFLFQRHIAYLKPNHKKVGSYYLYASLLSDSVQYQIDTHVKGIAQKTLNLKEIKNLKIPLPSLDEQKMFTVFFREVNKSKSVIQKSLDEMQILFQSLMQEYFG